MSLGGGTIDATYYNNGTSSVNVQVCFEGKTPILMYDWSSKAIRDIIVGDRVKARKHDDPSSSVGDYKVVRVFKNVKDTWTVTFTTASGEEFQIRGTAEHPFWLKGKGWTPLGELKESDQCVSAAGETIYVKSKQHHPEPIEVYNFEVEEAHTYFVGKNDTIAVLVHNECGSCGGNHSSNVTCPGGIFGPREPGDPYYGIPDEDLYNITPSMIRRAYVSQGPVKFYNAHLHTKTENDVISNVKLPANQQKLSQVLMIARGNPVWRLNPFCDNGEWAGMLGPDTCHRWVLGTRDSIVSLGKDYYSNSEYEVSYVSWNINDGGFADHGALKLSFTDIDGKIKDIQWYLDNGRIPYNDPMQRWGVPDVTNYPPLDERLEHPGWVWARLGVLYVGSALEYIGKDACNGRYPVTP